MRKVATRITRVIPTTTIMAMMGNITTRGAPESVDGLDDEPAVQ